MSSKSRSNAIVKLVISVAAYSRALSACMCKRQVSSAHNTLQARAEAAATLCLSRSVSSDWRRSAMNLHVVIEQMLS